MDDRAIFNALPAAERDALGFRQWQWQQRQGTHWKGCWRDGGPQHWQCAVDEAESWYQQAQDRTDDALRFAAERDELRANVASAVLAEREACANVCDERAMKNEAAAQEGGGDDARSLRSAAWQMAVCAAAIRARGKP